MGMKEDLLHLTTSDAYFCILDSGINVFESNRMGDMYFRYIPYERIDSVQVALTINGEQITVSYHDSIGSYEVEITGRMEEPEGNNKPNFNHLNGAFGDDDDVSNEYMEMWGLKEKK